MEYVPFGAPSSDSIKLSCNIVRSLICQPTKTGKLPTDQDCMRFMMMCQARRLNPFEGDSFMLGYDTQSGPKFSLITAHQAFLKRAELNEEYNGMKSGVILRRDGTQLDVEGDFHEETDEILGGWATVFFKHRDNPMHKRVRLKRFRKDTPIWRDDPAGMICKCAEADALRSSFPTMLGGLYLKEELESEASVDRISKPIFNVPEIAPAPAETKAIEAVTVVAARSPIEEVWELCKKDGVKESDLLEFMATIGLTHVDAATLEEAELTEAGSMDKLIAQWPYFVEQIKKVTT